MTANAVGALRITLIRDVLGVKTLHKAGTKAFALKVKDPKKKIWLVDLTVEQLEISELSFAWT